VEAAFREHRPSAVLNFAAETHVDRSIDGPRAFVETNTVGAFELLETARRFLAELAPAERERFRLLHVSTDEVYGSLGREGSFCETTPYAPNSPYSATKAAADHLVRAWHKTYGMPTLVANACNNYGPYQFPEKLVPLTIVNALEARPLPVYGDGSNVRDWLYVEDHVRALWALLKRGRPGESYTVGGRSERSNLSVVAEICAVLDRRRPAGRPHGDLVTFVADRPGHDRRYAVDPGKIERIGWRARESFATGIEKTVDWYLANAAWWRPLRSGVYRGERLGLIQRVELPT
jgi:dTDP-glucose 4,6-dehydratase